jgi:hypothetical protein
VVRAADPPKDLESGMLKPEHAGKVVVGGSYLDIESIRRAQQLGIKAFVAGGLDDAVLKQLLGYDRGVAITGSEQLGLTVVITEGFGRMTVANRRPACCGCASLRARWRPCRAPKWR